MNRNAVKRPIGKSPLKSFITGNNKLNLNNNRRIFNSSNLQNKKNNLTNSNSVRKGSLSSNNEMLAKDKINKLKEYMPYIPNKERQRAEDHFIYLIKSIMNAENTEKISDKLNKYNSVKMNENERYKPKAYGYYELIRNHPLLIKNIDQNSYSKIMQNINKKSDDKNEYEKENEVTKINNKIKDFSLNKKNNLTEANIFKNEHKNYFLTEKNINSESHTNIGINKRNLKIEINDSNKEKNILEKNNNKIYLPIIKKDYRKSDIFLLVNDSLSKEKTSEKYLFKPNYSPRKLENDKKTNINEVGWSPKLEKNKSRIGCPSVPFNIINPSLKCLSPMKKEIDNMNKNNFEKPPLISDYVDMCKPGDTGLRKEYNDIFEENKNIFHRKNYCASYSDLHHEYKDIVNNIF